VAALVISARQETHAYEVRVGAGAARAAARLARGRDVVALVSCRKVLATPFGRGIESALRRASGCLVQVLPDGEGGKTLLQIQRAASGLLAGGATRGSLVVALGGGAVTDAAGFLAATFMRGVSWAAVPTTLLGMVDAALGGKTAVNLPLAKNAVGAFFPPIAVLSDPSSLSTLPPRQLRSGLGEVAKYAALRPELFDRVQKAARAGRADAGLVAACARIKLEIVERDPLEKGERKLLNLGHTFGHGVEAAGSFMRYTHGESVAIGLVFAFRLARALGRVDSGAVDAMEDMLGAAGLPVRITPPIGRRAVRLMGFDKKRTAGGLRWVLPSGRGDGRWTVEWDIVADPGAVEQAVSEIGGKP